MSSLRPSVLILGLALGSGGALATGCGGGGSSADAGGADARIDSAPAIDAVLPDGPLPDAPPISRACPADPTVIPAGTTVITLSGTVSDVSDDPIATATIDVFAIGSPDVPLATTISGVDGAYTVAVPVVAGAPALAAYARVRHADFVTNFIYPPDPIADDLAFDPILFDANSLDLLYGVLAGSERMADRSTFATVLLDCEFTPINGATLTVTPAAEDVIYLDVSGGLPVPENDGNTGASGVALAINVPLGMVAVGGAYAGVPLESHEVGSFVDGKDPAMTTTIVHPVPVAP